jgi:hypothetical protein
LLQLIMKQFLQGAARGGKGQKNKTACHYLTGAK